MGKVGRKAGRVEVIAHRGSGGPENTLSAFRRARQFGADWFECDVRLCASGEAVVIHDRGVGRTTGGKGRVEEMTLHQLRRLDAGGGERIPTLRQALALASRRFGAYVEAKVQGNARALAGAVVAQVRQARGRVVVQSFDTGFLEAAAQLAPTLPLELLVSTRPGRGWQRAIEFAVDHGLRGINLSQRTATRSLVAQIHDAGLRCAVYTVNDVKGVRKLAAWGVNGLITDDVHLCREVLGA
ncbi:MAG: glycerophosphodiester phosphodiesterase [Planctomycetes bacterium]|nr:glycerophosphodiester phosphodiesterase [Planctomycetota bacterium]MCW8136508.1 glycerophosphodiester phosphodiesterase [Planctomycetota bacterium]